jgi:hypothetical protein
VTTSTPSGLGVLAAKRSTNLKLTIMKNLFEHLGNIFNPKNFKDITKQFTSITYYFLEPKTSIHEIEIFLN